MKDGGPSGVHDDHDDIPEDLLREVTGMVVKTRAARTERLKTFAEARRHPQGTVILRSTMNDHPYVVCDGAMVACDEDALWQLLSDLDHVIWSDGGEAIPDLPAGNRLPEGGPSGGARVVYAILTFDDGDGGITAGGMWVHPDFLLRELTEGITAVLEGKMPRLGLTEVPPAPESAEIGW